MKKKIVDDVGDCDWLEMASEDCDDLHWKAKRKREKRPIRLGFFFFSNAHFFLVTTRERQTDRQTDRQTMPLHNELAQLYANKDTTDTQA